MSRCFALVVGVFAGLIVVESRADILFQDNFDDGDANGWLEIDGTLQVTNGEYKLTHDGTWPNVTRAVAMTNDFADFVVEAEATYLPGHGILTILFRIIDIGPGRGNGHYYQFSINSITNQADFCKIDDAAGCTVLSATPFNSIPGFNYRIRIEVEGTTAIASVNGTFLLSTDELADYPAGRIGLKFDTFPEPSNSAHWDNVVVETLNPEPPLRVTVRTVESAQFYLGARSLLVDLDGDGFADLIRTGINPAPGPALEISLLMMPGIGDGTFGAPIVLDLLEGDDFLISNNVALVDDFLLPIELHASDIDDDGDQDIVLIVRLRSQDGRILTWINEANMPFLRHDFDKDGDVDLSDFAAFALCYGGANNPPPPGCPPQ